MSRNEIPTQCIDNTSLARGKSKHIVARTTFFQAYEFFIFAGLMFLDMIILAYMATRYNYVDYSSRQNNSRDENTDQKEEEITIETDDEDINEKKQS